MKFYASLYVELRFVAVLTNHFDDDDADAGFLGGTGDTGCSDNGHVETLSTGRMGILNCSGGLSFVSHFCVLVAMSHWPSDREITRSFVEGATFGWRC